MGAGLESAKANLSLDAGLSTLDARLIARPQVPATTASIRTKFGSPHPRSLAMGLASGGSIGFIEASGKSYRRANSPISARQKH
jgi:hypothetical protein